jgi:hypothetical protein
MNAMDRQLLLDKWTRIHTNNFSTLAMDGDLEESEHDYLTRFLQFLEEQGHPIV